MTPKQRYDRYWTWCVILGVRPLSFTGWLWESERVPEHWPIAWNSSEQIRPSFRNTSTA